MPATISIHHIGDPGVEACLRAILTEHFNQLRGAWSVSVIGDQRNTVWQAEVDALDGTTAGNKKFYGEDGGHNAEVIMQWVSLVTRDAPRAHVAAV